ncbi:hypothetical protein DFJ73DRAFT_840716 [Zopfochytrium polystomum]|nr:hypothetical protein DFJ73DRAFT_840716 [Zopfochytrium polystomum]
MASNSSATTTTTAAASSLNVIITGASAGIGRELAFLYAAHVFKTQPTVGSSLTSRLAALVGLGIARRPDGLVLVLTARRLEMLEQLRGELTQAYPAEAAAGKLVVDILQLDVRDAAAVIAAVRGSVARHAHIDTVIANAGRGSADMPPLGTHEAFVQHKDMVDTNLVGLVATTYAAVEHFRATGRGHIVGISSVASFQAKSSYSASKAAVNSFLDTVREEVRDVVDPATGRKGGINVSVIHPGYVATEINRHYRNPPFMVSVQRGARDLFHAVIRRSNVAFVPPWPWSAIALVLFLIPHVLQNKFRPNLIKALPAAPAGPSTAVTAATPLLKKRKVVYITGASAGIGESLALRYAKVHVQRAEPIALVLLARTVSKLEGVKKSIEGIAKDAAPGLVTVHLQELDVSNGEDVYTTFRALAALPAPGPPHVVVANAGLLSKHTVGVDLDSTIPAVLKTIDTNVTGLCATANVSIELFRANGGGQFVTVGSVVAFRGFRQSATYAATKAFVRNYTHFLRTATAGDNIAVTGLHPGYVDTSMTSGIASRPMVISPERCAELMLYHIERRTTTAILPWPLWLLTGVLPFLPSPIFRALTA